MLLVATLDGARIDASAHTPESWWELKQSEDRERLLMPGCGLRAVARSSKLATRYFAHYRQVDCKVEHGGETPQHLAMKEALKLCINDVPGWHAVVEHPHPSCEWIVDVLAESDDRRHHVAFEVQLSSQAPDRYLARSQRYWLVPRGLDCHPTKVPVVVTGFNKSSAIPEDVQALLDLPANQHFVALGGDSLGSFVRALLLRGPSWPEGTPDEQELRRRIEEGRKAALAEAEREKTEVIEQRVAELNAGSSSPASAFGSYCVTTESQTFIWGSLTFCWNCQEPMLVWDTRIPGNGWKWTHKPAVDVVAVAAKGRPENHTEVHRVIDEWADTAKADVPKAKIQPRWIKASGRTYDAFVCPSCDTTFGQYYISRILPNKWSVLGGPDIKPSVASPVGPPETVDGIRKRARC